MAPATSRIVRPSIAARQEEYDDTQTGCKPTCFPVAG